MPGSDITSKFSGELIRPLLTIAIPGTLAGGPWFLLVQHFVSKSATWPSDDVGIGVFTFLLVALILFTGMLVDGAASMLEGTFLDAVRAKSTPALMTTWRRFLVLKYDGEPPTGHRYLRNYVQTFKFELCSAVALAIALPTWAPIRAVYSGDAAIVDGVAIVGVFLMVILFMLAWGSHRVLADTRELLVSVYPTTAEPPAWDAEFRDPVVTLLIIVAFAGCAMLASIAVGEWIR